ncbi:hypothetical protein GQ55_9G473900 [Panicum hallii var. hallii]|uniref:Uncharacterized protein n=1 Tax=Panicum hallii var. hallii TaxID=1504633 RepID=A0A2T7CCK7_9POAL|nr:hypothetical protein GQ55_9G473900 [Panicum hallii var. hallii]
MAKAPPVLPPTSAAAAVAVMCVVVVWLAAAAPVSGGGGAMGNPVMGALPLLVAARGSGRVEDLEPPEMDSEAHRSVVLALQAEGQHPGARRRENLVRSQSLLGQTWLPIRGRPPRL